MLMQLVAGQLRSLQVGDLPRPVAEHLKCHPAVVYLGHKEVLKIAGKHKEIIVPHLQYLPYAIKEGSYYEEAPRPLCVTILYTDKETSKSYLIGLKSAGRGGEVWVQTFHRIDETKVARKKSSCTLIYSGKRDRRSRPRSAYHSKSGEACREPLIAHMLVRQGYGWQIFTVSRF